MPRYRANAKILLAHESRTIPEGEEFSTTFPQVKVDGKMVDIRLGENVTLLGYTEAEEALRKQALSEAEGKAPAKRTPVVQD